MTSKNSGYQNKLYLRVVEYISKYKRLPKGIVSKQLMSYYVKKLKYDGVVKKIGYGVWQANMDKWRQVQFIEKVKKQGNDTKSIRGHGFHFRVALPRIENWSRLNEYLNKRGVLYTVSKGTWVGYRVIINGFKVWLCDHSLVIYAPPGKSYLHWTAELSKGNALVELEEIVHHVENMLHISIKVNGHYLYRVSKQHYAKIKDSMAKIVNEKKSRLVATYGGEEWLLFDRSWGLHEQETLHPKTGDVDMDNIVVPFYNDLKDHYVKTGEALTLGGLLQAIHQQQEQISSLLYKEPERLERRDNYFG